VRFELSRLDSQFNDTLVVAAEAGIPPEEIVARALARIRQRDAGRIGKLGERVARARERKTRIPSLSGTARFRVPDILTDTALIEVKNVSRLALTPQLEDFLSFADSSRISFVLLTRFDTVLAPDLAQLVTDGRIEHRQLSGLLSPLGRRVVRRLIASALNEEAEPDHSGRQRAGISAAAPEHR
jgi:hypothetical protein